MKESYLKKEFEKNDVTRIRNLIKKDYTNKTKVQTGYKESKKDHKEGDVWEEKGKTWTIKNGIKQNKTKLDTAKKLLQYPLTCPNCGKPLKSWLDKKMYRIHGFCFDPCTVEYETSLRKAGLYKQYEKRMMEGNMKIFLEDIEQWLFDQINNKDTYVTEDGDIEKWKSNSSKNQEFSENIKKYSLRLKEHLK